MKWLWHIAVTKAIKKVIQLIISYLLSLNLQRFGLSIDSAQLTVAIFAAMEVARNYLKTHFKLGWL